LLRVLKKQRAAGSHSSFHCRGSNPFFDTSTLAVLQLQRVRKNDSYLFDAAGVFGHIYKKRAGSCFKNLHAAGF
jgi:hypothetical protein